MDDKQPEYLFEAKIIDGQFMISIKSRDLLKLSLAKDLLFIDIQKRQIQALEQTKVSSPIVTNPTLTKTIMDKLNGR